MNSISATGSSKTVSRSSAIRAEFPTSTAFSAVCPDPWVDDRQVVDPDVDGARDRQRRAVSRIYEDGGDPSTPHADGQGARDLDALAERVPAGPDADRSAARGDDLLDRLLDGQCP